MEGGDWDVSSEGATDYDDDVDGDEEYSTFENIPKLQIRKNISKARWDDEMEMAEVVEKRGSMWRTMGIVRGGKTYYSIEETLFLAERGELDLSSANESLVLLEAIYKKIAEGKCGCCYDYYEVYRKLRSLGYIVGRHGISWSFKSHRDKSISVESHLEKTMIPIQNAEELRIIHIMFDNISINEIKPVFDVYPPNSNFRKSCPGDPSFVLCVIRGEPPSKDEIEDVERRCNNIPLKLCHVEHGSVSFFSFNQVELPLLP